MAISSRIRRKSGCLLFVLIAVLPGCSAAGTTASEEPAEQQSVAAAGVLSDSASASPAVSSSVSPSAEPSTEPTPTPTPTLAPSGKPASTLAGLSALDRLAGLRSTTVAWKAGGRLITVPGHSAAPGKGRVYTVEVQVESGIDLDRAAFARFVLNTVNDRRSWTQRGTRRFARIDHGPADIRVILASPATSAALCLPLRTFGKLSCHAGSNRAVLTYYRWVRAIPGYDGNHTGYRQYVVNHEVGHVLGHHHEYCAGKGKPAPLMMQQTKGLKGCRPNPWPFP